MSFNERAAFQAEVAKVEQWWKDSRFARVTRPYTAAQVVSKRGTIPISYPSNLQAKKLWGILSKRFQEGTPSHTYGALDPIQVTQMAKYLESVYVSGWQSSSTASSTNEPGPDLADYPSNTVPNKVEQLFMAQLFHDRKQREYRSNLSEADRAGKTGAALEAVEEEWMNKANIQLFSTTLSNALRAQTNANAHTLERFNQRIAHVSYADAVQIAKKEFGLKSVPFWDWDAPRTREGYYRYQGGTQCAVNRAVAFAPYADLLWMETKSPILAQAREFAHGVHAVYPQQWLAYNLSPSFNWDAAGLGEADMKAYVWELGKLGFVWQFITLAGLHSNAYISDLFAKSFATEGMKAYVELIQRKEREISCDVLTHQRWSGADYMDNLMKTVTGGVSSTAAMGKGVTESQFEAKSKL
ncbi:unnamed protein product [Somion occarium]|uniref:methylisocitrate lyase n=1 Tax=Somion occarium TaxID=3059160 RepID=A0ABP1E067_9APHY